MFCLIFSGLSALSVRACASAISQGLRIGNHDEYLVEFPGILELNPPFQRTHIMSEMQPSGRPVSRKYNLFHLINFPNGHKYNDFYP